MPEPAGGPWLKVEAGRGSRRADAGTAPLEVDADVVLRVSAGGLPPGEAVELWLGDWQQRIRADDEGGLYWADRDWLRAVAGEVRVRLLDLEIVLNVRPTKLMAEDLRAIVDELEALAAGLAGDLGGHGLHDGSGTTAEGALERLEAFAGVVTEATAWIRRNPLSIERVSRRPFAAAEPQPTSPADVRWRARSAAALRVAAGGRPVGVAVTRSNDLDRPENRGVVGLLASLSALVEAVGASVVGERARIERDRAWRQRFRTRRSNLYDEVDRPRLQQLETRERRVEALRDEFRLARVRAGLPRGLVAQPVLPRTASVEAHPGYWNLRRVWEDLAGIRPILERPRLLPLRNLDALYEVWCVVQVARALAERDQAPPSAPLRVRDDGWFAYLPQGSLGRHARGELELLYEPQIGPGREGEFVRVDGGRAPLQPDVAIVERRPGQPVRLHLFDVKHQRGKGPRGVPPDALQAVWWKYGESIADPATRAPVVASVWILYPARGVSPSFVAPGMARAEWPAMRLRGGAIPLAPGATAPLHDILDLLLGPAPAAQGGP